MTDSLQFACDNLFYIHKSNDNSHYWSKSSYTNKPLDLDAAKDLMLHKNILFEQTTKSGQYRTFLNPDITEANSFAEALELLKEIEKNNTVNFHGPVTNINGDNSGQVIQESSFSNSRTTNKVADTPKKKATITNKTLLSKLLDSRISKILGTIILTLLTAYIVYRLRWN